MFERKALIPCEPLGGHYVGPKSWNFFTCQCYRLLGSRGHPCTIFRNGRFHVKKARVKTQARAPTSSYKISCFYNDLPLKLENLGAHALIEWHLQHAYCCGKVHHSDSGPQESLEKSPGHGSKFEMFATGHAPTNKIDLIFCVKSKRRAARFV